MAAPISANNMPASSSNSNSNEDPTVVSSDHTNTSPKPQPIPVNNPALKPASDHTYAENSDNENRKVIMRIELIICQWE